jgi:hypothetical protein
MALKIKYGNEDISFSKVEFNPDNSCFDLSGNTPSMGENVTINVNYALKVENEYNYKNFTIYILENPNCKENSIFEVYDKTQGIRIGWIFPMQSLVSSEHDYKDNIYFLKYAYVATEILLRGVDFKHIEEVDFYDYPYSLIDFYKSDSIVFIVDNDNISKLDKYEFDYYIPDLYKYGYCISGKNELDYFDDINKRLNLNRITSALSVDSYVIELFSNFLGKETSPLLKFYLLYQVIELILEKIFNKEFKEMIQQLSQDEKLSFNVKEELQNISKEKYRIKRLFSEYSNGINSSEELKLECNKLLEEQSIKNGTVVADSLYSVRNLLVHSYRDLTSKQIKMISNINIYFEKCIIELVTTGLKDNF